MNTYGTYFVEVRAAPKVKLVVGSVHSVDKWLRQVRRPEVRDALLDARLHLMAKELVEDWRS